MSPSLLVVLAGTTGASIVLFANVRRCTNLAFASIYFLTTLLFALFTLNPAMWNSRYVLHLCFGVILPWAIVVAINILTRNGPATTRNITPAEGFISILTAMALLFPFALPAAHLPLVAETITFCLLICAAGFLICRHCLQMIHPMQRLVGYELRFYLFPALLLALVIDGFAQVSIGTPAQKALFTILPLIVLITILLGTVALCSPRFHDLDAFVQNLRQNTIFFVAVFLATTTSYTLLDHTLSPPAFVSEGIAGAVGLLIAFGILSTPASRGAQPLSSEFRAYFQQALITRQPLPVIEQKVRDMLARWGHTKDIFISCTPTETITETHPTHWLRCAGWITPEALAIRPKTAFADKLALWIDAERLGAVVYARSGKLEIAIGIGYSADSRPISYQNIVILQQVAQRFAQITDILTIDARQSLGTRMAGVALLSESIAHSIGNPLCAISNYVQLLVDRPPGLDDDTLLTKISPTIVLEVNQLDRLAEQLTTLAELPHEQPAEVRLDELLTTAVHILSDLATAKTISIHYTAPSTPIEITTNAQALQRAILSVGIHCFSALKLHLSPRIDIWTDIRETQLNIQIRHSALTIDEADCFKFSAIRDVDNLDVGLPIASDILDRLGYSIQRFIETTGTRYQITIELRTEAAA